MGLAPLVLHYILANPISREKYYSQKQMEKYYSQKHTEKYHSKKPYGSVGVGAMEYFVRLNIC